MKFRIIIVTLFFAIIVLIAFSANAAEEFRPMIPKELRPSEKVRESFDALVKVGFAGDEFSGWFVAPDIIATAGHKRITMNATASDIRAFIGNKQGKTITAHNIYYNANEDLALFRVDEAANNNARVVQIRKEPPRPKELLWWRCESGILEKEWSVGVYLKREPRHINSASPTEPGYLISALIGGNSLGCSGSPVVDNEGRAVARISGSIGSASSTTMHAGTAGSENSDVQMQNIIATSADSIAYALTKVETQILTPQSPTLPGWMMPPDAVRNNFTGVVEINLLDGQTRSYGSAWLIRPNIVVTGGHYYNKSEISENATVHLKDRNGTIWPLVKIPSGNTDIALFRLHSTPNLPVLPLREEKPDENGDELLWWYCASGLLQDEWSMGRFLGEIPPSGALAGVFQENVYLTNTIAGGIHAGCTGSPVMDYRGRVVGLATAFMPGGSFNNILAIRAEDIRRALEFAEKQKGEKK